MPDAEVPYEVRLDPPNLAIEDYDVSTVWQQDRVVWETQGTIADRSRENLAATDRGIVMFRRMLQGQIDLVESGAMPDVAVVAATEAGEIISFDSATHAMERRRGALVSRSRGRRLAWVRCWASGSVTIRVRSFPGVSGRACSRAT